MKLYVHQMRSGSSSSVSIRLPRSALLILLNAYLTSMNNAPAIIFSPYACWVRFMSTATASMHDLRLRQLYCPLCSPFFHSRWSAIRWPAIRSTSLLKTSKRQITR